MTDFYDYYNNRPPKVNTVLTDDTCFVSQSECQNSSLKYVLDRFGMNTLTARMEEMRGKFGYADCTVSNDFAILQNRYVQAKNYFENLPSNVRRQFHDNPLEFYNNLAQNPKKALDDGFFPYFLISVSSSCSRIKISTYFSTALLISSSIACNFSFGILK